MCRGFIDAQIEYAAMGHDGQTAGSFAANCAVMQDNKMGLYWPVGEGKPAARPGGSRQRRWQRATRPWWVNALYHGYYYRIPVCPRAAANGESKEYFVEGQLRDGVALIAWPADWR